MVDFSEKNLMDMDNSGQDYENIAFFFVLLMGRTRLKAMSFTGFS
jgi:hypothetical protein